LATALLALVFATRCSDAKTISLLGGTPELRLDGGGPDAAPPQPKPECAENGDCVAPKPFCDTLASRCVQCLANEDCTTLVCDAVTHACTGCVTNNDCDPATPYCDRDDRRCVECESAAQCPPGEVCAWGAHRCAPACNTNSDCAGSGRAICAVASRVCVECTGDADCAAQNLPPYCDLRLGACVDCLADTNCASGHCEPLEHM
jgi:hypothetical protein